MQICKFEVDDSKSNQMKLAKIAINCVSFKRRDNQMMALQGALYFTML